MLKNKYDDVLKKSVDRSETKCILLIAAFASEIILQGCRYFDAASALCGKRIPME